MADENKRVCRSESSSNWRQRVPVDDEKTKDNVRGFTGWDSLAWSKEPGSRYHDAPPAAVRRKEPAAAAAAAAATTAVEDPPAAVPLAVTERRRLYVGNMPYMAKKQDVVDLFGSEDVNPYRVERIEFSTDPFTGRNPSYCFVDVETEELAQQAMAELEGTLMLDRPVKIGLGKARSNWTPLGRRDAGKPIGSPFAYERWSRDDASAHWYGYADQGRRLHVGNMPRISHQHIVDYEVRKVFYGFKVEAISKLITQGGVNCYLFVDLESAEEAERALAALDGVSAIFGQRLSINRARGNSHKPAERDRWKEQQEKKKYNPEHLLDAPINADGIVQSLV